ncbi:MAG TPA: Xaa-Pro peptidase family protein [Chloroflexota bacterium]|nr:Xaa-Pro peptidase family protein [Chloroflexota bacterium]
MDIPPPGEEVARLREALAAAGLDAVLLSEPASIRYASGFSPPLPIGAGAAFAAGPNLAAVSDQASGLLVSTSEAGAAARRQETDSLISYPSFGHFEPVDGRKEFLAGLASLLESVLPVDHGATLGIEPRTLPAVGLTFLSERYPRVAIRDAAAAIRQARLIKTPREITLLRHAAAAADAGQEALLSSARPGVGELALWNVVTGAIEAVAGAPTPISGELISGPRTSVVDYPGGPINRLLAPGDSIICDISPCVDGYYADCCNTLVAGEPSPDQRRYFLAAREAWEAAVAMLRPGKRACDAAAAAREAFARHGLPVAHYTGHGIGAAVNEAPRLVEYDRTPIEAGMVFAVEPGAYAGPGGTTGARVEKMVLVTADGPEVLSRFTWGIG